MSVQNKKILKFINEGRKQNGFDTFRSINEFERFRGKIFTEDEKAILLESCKGLEQLCQDKVQTEKGKSLKDLGVSPVKSASE